MSLSPEQLKALRSIVWCLSEGFDGSVVHHNCGIAPALEDNLRSLGLTDFVGIGSCGWCEGEHPIVTITDAGREALEDEG